MRSWNVLASKAKYAKSLKACNGVWEETTAMARVAGKLTRHLEEWRRLPAGNFPNFCPERIAFIPPEHCFRERSRKDPTISSQGCAGHCSPKITTLRFLVRHRFEGTHFDKIDDDRGRK